MRHRTGNGKSRNDFGYEVALVPEKFARRGPQVEALGKFSGGLRSLAGCRILLARAQEGAGITAGPNFQVAELRLTLVPAIGLSAQNRASVLQRVSGITPELIVFNSFLGCTKYHRNSLGHEDGEKHASAIHGFPLLAP